MTETRTQAMLSALEAQRNAALTENVHLHAALAEALAQVKALQTQPKAANEPAEVPDPAG